MKSFNKLSLAVLMLGATLIVFSFIPDLEIWRDTFQYKMERGWECTGPVHGGPLTKKESYEHWHWNYRGWIWFLTGFALFIIQVARIVFIFKDRDFKE